tara:strand:+ start:2722 stop:3033 length:312 start_codon:yes stop_codon:yes gene_type:complete
MQTIYDIVDTGARMLCSLRSKELVPIPENVREPTEKEMLCGIPEWFLIQEVPRYPGKQIDKYYFSIDGHKFHSVREVKEWRENLQFEFSDTTIDTTIDEAPCF